MNLSNCWIQYFVQGKPPTTCDDWDADGTLNAADTDSDNDGCPDAGEPALGLDPLDPWDFYSVPLPALFGAPNPVGLHPDNYVAAADGQAVFAYFERGARSGSPDYVADLNQNGIHDGLEYDRSILGSTESGPPDGVISASDAQVAFAQFQAGFRC
jgi:hypothetical protein